MQATQLIPATAASSVLTSRSLRGNGAEVGENTVVVHDLVSDNAAGVEWVVIDALSGRSVADVLHEEIRLGVDETRYIARSVLAAIEAARPCRSCPRCRRHPLR